MPVSLGPSHAAYSFAATLEGAASLIRVGTDVRSLIDQMTAYQERYLARRALVEFANDFRPRLRQLVEGPEASFVTIYCGVALTVSYSASAPSPLVSDLKILDIPPCGSLIIQGLARRAKISRSVFEAIERLEPSLRDLSEEALDNFVNDLKPLRTINESVVDNGRRLALKDGGMLNYCVTYGLVTLYVWSDAYLECDLIYSVSINSDGGAGGSTPVGSRTLSQAKWTKRSETNSAETFFGRSIGRFAMNLAGAQGSGAIAKEMEVTLTLSGSFLNCLYLDSHIYGLGGNQHYLDHFYSINSDIWISADWPRNKVTHDEHRCWLPNGGNAQVRLGAILARLAFGAAPLDQDNLLVVAAEKLINVQTAGLNLVDVVITLRGQRVSVVLHTVSLVRDPSLDGCLVHADRYMEKGRLAGRLRRPRGDAGVSSAPGTCVPADRAVVVRLLALIRRSLA